jgi:hypothetical protein
VGLVRCQLRSDHPQFLDLGGFGRPFCCAGCDASHGATRGVALFVRQRPGGQEFRRCLSHELRLAISSETEALIRILVVRRTLKLADALVRQAAIL